MANMIKLKIMNSGRIPGYPVNGPVLHPIEVTKEQAMRFITAGLDVRVWVDQLKQYVKFSPRDMVDFYNDKNYIGFSTDEDHNYDGDDCGVCEEGFVNIDQLIASTRVKQADNNNARVVAKPRISSNEPIVYVIEENTVNNVMVDEIPPEYYNEEPDFGDAYEPTPFEAFGLDDFEEK